MIIKRKKGFFSISAVAKMFSVHQQTIRLYEKQGLITPERSAGNTRLFSEEDIERLEEIIHLTHELGINLAGVEMIFKLKKQIKKLQKDMNKVFDDTQKELDKEADQAKQIVKDNSQRLITYKQLSKKHPDHYELDQSEHTQSEQSMPVDLDLWEIEYED